MAAPRENAHKLINQPPNMIIHRATSGRTVIEQNHGWIGPQRAEGVPHASRNALGTAIGVRDSGSVQHPIRARMKDLRRMLNEWDFIGVGAFSAHDDEYDCLVGPLLTRLASGANVEELAGFLRGKIESHFGLDPGNIDVAGFAVKTVAWWEGNGRGDGLNNAT